MKEGARASTLMGLSVMAAIAGIAAAFRFPVNPAQIPGGPRYRFTPSRQRRSTIAHYLPVAIRRARRKFERHNRRAAQRRAA